MTQESDASISVTAADVQAVMQQDRVFALEVQNRALMRKISELANELQVERSTHTNPRHKHFTHTESKKED